MSERVQLCVQALILEEHGYRVGDGNDVIHAAALQSDLLDAFPGTDPWLTGGDAIDGGEGNDVIEGGAGHDYLLDDAGDKLLYGGAGNDVLDALGEHDTLAGWSRLTTFPVPTATTSSTASGATTRSGATAR